jgi:hypothetical protein
MNATILTADADLMAGLAVATGFSLFVIIFGMLMVILLMIAKWKIFSKAGEKGWKSLIPVYGTYVEYGFTWNHKQGILFLVAVLLLRVLTGVFDSDSIMYSLAAIPGIYAAVLSVIQLHKLSKSFGHGAGFTVGLLLMNPIFLLILGFGKSQYVGNALKAE